MKRLWLFGIIPPVIVTAVALLVIPLGYVSTGGFIGIAFLLIAYVTQITLPVTAPKTQRSFVFSGSYGLVVYPYLIATAAIALVAVAVSALSWKWVLAADIVVAGLAAMAILGTTAMTQKDARLSATNKRQVDDLRLMALSVDQFGQSLPDAAEAGFARKVAEQLRMSPFVAVPASADIEADVAAAVAELRNVAPGADLATVHSALARISSLVRHRNEILKYNR